jgi:hypothetical protein
MFLDMFLFLFLVYSQDFSCELQERDTTNQAGDNALLQS